MKPLFSSFLTLLLCGLFSGCVQVDYFGQSFDPTPETSPVEYFTSRDEIPAGKYRIIGRGTIATEMRVDKYDIREALIEAARKHGADAVAAVSVNQVRVGIYPSDDNFDGSPTHPDRAESFNPSSSETADKVFGKPAEVKGGAVARTETHVRALFLKDKATLEQIFARRGKGLDELVKQPEPKNAESLTEKPHDADDAAAGKSDIFRDPGSTK